jgi:hypothetical protein
MAVSQRAKDLAERLGKFNEEVISFVKECKDEDWRKTSWEDWPIGVVARHIGANHIDGATKMAGMIVKGVPSPEMTMEQINNMANEHARKHADCTKAEVLDVLRKTGDGLVQFVAGLDDASLDRTSYLPAMGAEVSTLQLIENVVLTGAGEHFDGIKKAVGA